MNSAGRFSKRRSNFAVSYERHKIIPNQVYLSVIPQSEDSKCALVLGCSVCARRPQTVLCAELGGIERIVYRGS